MIAYDLQCSNGHQFEGWFEDSQSFDRQKKQGLIACPVCEDTAVFKLPSTFAIKGTSDTVPMTSDGKRDLAALGRVIEARADRVAIAILLPGWNLRRRSPVAAVALLAAGVVVLEHNPPG